MARKDFIDEIVQERAEVNPRFPALVEAALRRRELLRSLAAMREKLGVSQTSVAARMNTSQSAVARLESGEADARLSTVERMAAALGCRIDWRLVPSGSAGSHPLNSRKVRGGYESGSRTINQLKPPPKTLGVGYKPAGSTKK